MSKETTYVNIVKHRSSPYIEHGKWWMSVEVTEDGDKYLGVVTANSKIEILDKYKVGSTVSSDEILGVDDL